MLDLTSLSERTGSSNATNDPHPGHPNLPSSTALEIDDHNSDLDRATFTLYLAILRRIHIPVDARKADSLLFHRNFNVEFFLHDTFYPYAGPLVGQCLLRVKELTNQALPLDSKAGPSSKQNSASDSTRLLCNSANQVRAVLFDTLGVILDTAIGKLRDKEEERDRKMESVAEAARQRAEKARLEEYTGVDDD